MSWPFRGNSHSFGPYLGQEMSKRFSVGIATSMTNHHPLRILIQCDWHIRSSVLCLTLLPNKVPDQLQLVATSCDYSALTPIIPFRC